MSTRIGTASASREPWSSRSLSDWDAPASTAKAQPREIGQLALAPPRPLGGSEARGAESGAAKISDYGDALQTGKSKLNEALRANGIDPSSEKGRALHAMASIETNDLQSGTDKSKGGDSANFSIFNVNQGVLKELGIDGKSIDGPENLNKAVKAMSDGIDKFGLDTFMDRVRNGTSGHDANYNNAVKSNMAAYAKDPSLLTDGRRLEHNIPYK